jgi:tetratricopeptide (TPR) repeat protein
MMSRTAASTAENRRIDSWKEIAAFFGRDERTVKRWEKERGLPVHRLPGERGGVFAWSHELTAWLNSSADAQKAIADSPPATPAAAVPPTSQPQGPPAPAAAIVPQTPASPTAEARSRPAWIWLSAGILALAAVLVVELRVLHHTFNKQSLFAHAHSTLHHVPDPESQEFYLKGRYYWSRRTEDSLRQAIDAFTQAVVHDSNYAQAYAGLAECYDLMPEFSPMPRSEAFPRAIAAARKAVALDDSLGEAHRALAFALFYWEWKVPAALAEYQRAIELDPRDEEAHHWYATSLLTLGRFQESMVEIDKARQLSPASRSILCDQALIRYWAGDRAPAIEKLKEIEQAEPEFFSPPRYLAAIAFAEKDYRTFIEQTRRLATISNDAQLTEIASAAQSGLSHGGGRSLLDAVRTVQQRQFDTGHSSGFDLARTCALLGRKQDAVTYLKAAVANHDYMVLSIANDQTFALLSGDPAFEQLEREVTARIYRA